MTATFLRSQRRITTADGCWKVWDGFTAYSRTGRRQVTYKLYAQFCTKKNKLSWVGSREIIPTEWPQPFPQNQIIGWTYAQTSFEPGRAGGPTTIVKVDGVFELCVFKHGCAPYSRKAAWIKIALYGDGRATCTNWWDDRERACARISVPKP